MTYRYAANYLIEKFKQLGDDRKISLRLAAFCIQVVANKIKYGHLKNQEVTEATGAYLTVFDNVSVTKNAMDSTFELPASIFDLKVEGGIEFIAHQMDKACDYLTVTFSRTTAGKLWSLKSNPFTKPSSSNPVFWREGSTIHLDGISCTDEDTIIVGLYTTVPISFICDFDTEIPIDGQYDQFVLIEAEGLLRFGYAVSQERMNDGTDMVERINKVNEQLEIPAGTPVGQQQQQSE